ncbi:MAG: hypothetical protein ACJAVW_003616 [Spirosomataceae bacterium]|jgi:hypothetical protein
MTRDFTFSFLCIVLTACLGINPSFVQNNSPDAKQQFTYGTPDTDISPEIMAVMQQSKQLN